MIGSSTPVLPVPIPMPLLQRILEFLQQDKNGQIVLNVKGGRILSGRLVEDWRSTEGVSDSSSG